MPDFHVAFRDVLHAVNPRHGTHGFASFPKEGALRIFLALKNPTASAGFEPANLGTKGQHSKLWVHVPQSNRSLYIRVLTIHLLLQTIHCPQALNIGYCQISGFRRDVVEAFGLVGCYTV
jgi:hypothetical protein